MEGVTCHRGLCHCNENDQTDYSSCIHKRTIDSKVSEKNIANTSVSFPVNINFYPFPLSTFIIAENYCANTFPGIYKLFGSSNSCQIINVLQSPTCAVQRIVVQQRQSQLQQQQFPDVHSDLQDSIFSSTQKPCMKGLKLLSSD
ncbi:hypothetical protein WUBG_02976 [Wuchereria bancrofti]|uniref:Uncharacterized protein n=1 Tax=Wuchereria bancrofti TaxID=6293 RepID=J9EU67_WUCBA|nr:hypothetical protein WUBG_02976 [Wuchereria bancrofti]